MAVFNQKNLAALLANKLAASVLLAVFVLGGIGVVLRAFPASNPFYHLVVSADLGIRNTLLQAFPEKSLHPGIVVVTIDDRTLSDTTGLGRWQDFRRDYYAKVVDRLKKDGAAVIGIDVLFSEKSATGDDELAKSIRHAGNVVLGFSRGQSIFPLPELSSGATSEGFFDPVVEPSNGNVYSVHPTGKADGKLFESFSFAVLRRYFDSAYAKNTKPSADPRKYERVYEFYDGDYRYVPYASDSNGNEFLISYLPPGFKFPKASFSDVYKAETSGTFGDYRPEMVRDKIVLIGATATGLHDEFLTPVGILNGIFVHANSINTILNRNYVTEVSKWVEIIILVLTAFFFALFLLHVGSRAYQVLVSVCVLAAAGIFCFVLFAVFRKELNYPFELFLTGALISLGATGYKYMLEEKGKRLLKNALSQYLAEDIVKSVLSDYDKVKLGGDRREVTLFFSDIAGFTSISENMEPEELVGFLSVYLKEASDIIMKERGFVNKYEGDAVMAIWGAFKEEPEQARLACLAALDQQRKLLELNLRFKNEFGFEIAVRMGINKGPAVVGNIGSEGKKIEFTALGDTVNTASRFEGINKLYGTLICVGESVAVPLGGQFVFRKLDSIMVKGKEKPTAIYELVGLVDEVPAPRLTMITEFERALSLYVAGNVHDGHAIFERLWKDFRDPPSEVFMNRCGKLVEEGVPEGWTGVYRATEK